MKIKKDATYSLWLGLVYLYAFLSDTDSRVNYLTESFRIFSSNLIDIMCIGYSRSNSKNNEISKYANLGCVIVLIECFRNNINIDRAKEPEDYATLLKAEDNYLGYIAWSLIYLKVRVDKEQLGI